MKTTLDFTNKNKEFKTPETEGKKLFAIIVDKNPDFCS